MKARKAKYGFKCFHPLSLYNILELAKIIEMLKDSYPSSCYDVELAGMNQRDFRLYTDDEDTVTFIRNNFVK